MKNSHLTSLVIYLLLQSVLLHGQKPTKESFDKSIDYLAFKVVEQSMMDSDAIEKTKLFQSKYNQESFDIDSIRSFLVKYDLDKTVQLLDDLGKLKRSYNSIESIPEAVEFLIKESFNNELDYPMWHSFVDASKHPNIINLLNDLQSEIESKLEIEQDFMDEIKLYTIEKVREQTQIFHSEVKSLKRKITILYIILFIFVVLLSISIVYLVVRLSSLDYKINQSNSGQKNKMHAHKKMGQNGLNQPQKSELERLKADFEQQRSEIEKLREEIQSDKNISIVENQKPAIEFDNQIKTYILYFPNPSKNGDFNTNRGIKYKESGKTIYKFEIQSSNPDHAFFSIDLDEISQRKALAFASEYLRPACEFLNEYNTEYKKIKTVDKGMAKREDQEWKVVEKAKIKFE